MGRLIKVTLRKLCYPYREKKASTRPKRANYTVKKVHSPFCEATSGEFRFEFWWQRMTDDWQEWLHIIHSWHVTISVTYSFFQIINVTHWYWSYNPQKMLKDFFKKSKRKKIFHISFFTSDLNISFWLTGCFQPWLRGGVERFISKFDENVLNSYTKPMRMVVLCFSGITGIKRLMCSGIQHFCFTLLSLTAYRTQIKDHCDLGRALGERRFFLPFFLSSVLVCAKSNNCYASIPQRRRKGNQTDNRLSRTTNFHSVGV